MNCSKCKYRTPNNECYIGYVGIIESCPLEKGENGMKKKKETKSGLGDYIIKDLNGDSLAVANKTIEAVNRYAKMMDGSKLSYEEEKEIHKLCALNPKIMDLICDAFFNNGYDSF